MTQRIKEAAQLHTTHVFYGHITEELTGTELVTRTMIDKVTFKRFRVTPTVFGGGSVDTSLDPKPVIIIEREYELYDTLQPGLDYSTEGKPYTFVWRVGTVHETFFEEIGRYYVVLRFHSRDEGEVEMLTFDVNVT